MDYSPLFKDENRNIRIQRLAIAVMATMAADVQSADFAATPSPYMDDPVERVQAPFGAGTFGSAGAELFASAGELNDGTTQNLVRRSHGRENWWPGHTRRSSNLETDHTGRGPNFNEKHGGDTLFCGTAGPGRPETSDSVCVFPGPPGSRMVPHTPVRQLR